MSVVNQVKTTNIDPTNGVSICQAIYNFVSTYTDKISYTSGESRIKFNDKFYFSIPNGFSSYGNGYLIREDSSQLGLGNFQYWTSGAQGLRMTLKIVGPVFILRLARDSNPENRGTIYWIDSNEKQLFTKVASDTLSIDIGSYYDALVEGPVYSLKTLINFSAPPQKIAYSGYACATDASSNLVQLSGLYSCSTATRDLVLTISGRNYYVIGANFLVDISS